MGSVATTYTEKYRKPFAPVMPGVTFVKFNDVDDLKKKFDDDVCAVCIETMQGEGGIHPVSREFLEDRPRADQEIRRASAARRDSVRSWAHGKDVRLSALRR